MDPRSYAIEWIYLKIISVPRNATAFYSFIFFVAMIVHELALEAASNAFQEFDDLANGVTLFQFGSCFALPLILTRGEALKTFPCSFNEFYILDSNAMPYIKLSVVVAGATSLATRSLVYVSYPTKVIFKSAKLIPTMIIDSYFDRGNISSKYSFLDYLAALFLCAGATGYTFSDNSDYNILGEQKNQDQIPTQNISSSSFLSNYFGSQNFGALLLLISVCCDAFLPNLQLQLMKKKSKDHNPQIIEESNKEVNEDNLNNPNSNNTDQSDSGTLNIESSKKKDNKGNDSVSSLMVNTNGIGVMVLLVYFLSVGSLVNILSACLESPLLLGYFSIVGLGLSSAVLAYTSLVKHSGPVIAVAVATLRKVVTVILSYFFFPKPLSLMHLCSALLVLFGVLLSKTSVNLLLP